MEKKINTKIEDYVKQFKDDIRNYIISDLGVTLTGKSQNERRILEYIFQYKTLQINKADLTKRKRIKNVVPLHERCCALRANSEQCTRRKKNGSNFCGTHVKGTPHGKVDDVKIGPKITKKQVWAQEIHGINYYIDDENNVYDHEDIIANVQNPKVIAKYKRDIATGTYTIPSLLKAKVKAKIAANRSRKQSLKKGKKKSEN